MSFEGVGWPAPIMSRRPFRGWPMAHRRSAELSVFRRVAVSSLALLGVLLSFSAGHSRSLPREALVAAVFDGDTILLDTGDKVRYLGIDAPEPAHDGEPADCYAREAEAANAAMVLHRRVTLEFDREKRDRFGRLLAYVFTMDGRCVNAELLGSGHARVFTTLPRHRLAERFLSRQRDAMAEGRGMWSACPARQESYYILNRRSLVFHRPACELGRNTSARNRLRLETRREALERGFRPCRVCKP